jgi:hypothetical protein
VSEAIGSPAWESLSDVEKLGRYLASTEAKIERLVGDRDKAVADFVEDYDARITNLRADAESDRLAIADWGSSRVHA